MSLISTSSWLLLHFYVDASFEVASKRPLMFQVQSRQNFVSEALMDRINNWGLWDVLFADTWSWDWDGASTTINVLNSVANKCYIVEVQRQTRERWIDDRGKSSVASQELIASSSGKSDVSGVTGCNSSAGFISWCFATWWSSGANCVCLKIAKS